MQRSVSCRSTMIFVLFAALSVHSFVDAQEDAPYRLAQRPARAQELYEEMCEKGGNVFRNSNLENPCMCNFLLTMSPARMDLSSVKGSEVPCVNGFVTTSDDKYPCHNVNLMSRVSLQELLSVHGSPAEEANDIWGWTGDGGQEIAIIGLMSGTSFVDVTDPYNPVFLGNLPSHGEGKPTYWRDIKTLSDYAYIVSENEAHGLQVIDMKQMVGRSAGPIQFTETGHHGGFGTAHNIAIHEESKTAFVLGSSECSGGLYMLNLTDPENPSFAGCFDEDGYVHDVQCVYYRGADTRYQRREICFACNEDTVTIVDVTEKDSPVQLSRTSYPGVKYTHQGWLKEDHNTFFFGDEEDESKGSVERTTTYVLNVEDLVEPFLVGSRSSSKNAIDHNMYVLDEYIYQANYYAGLQVLKINDVKDSVNLTETAFFDVHPESDGRGFAGAWSNYPYFPSGNVIVSSIDRGLFVLKADVTGPSFEPAVSPTTDPGGDSCKQESNSCSSWLGGIKGLYMHRNILGGRFCWRRCILKTSVEFREKFGWRCGKHCS